MNEVRLINAEDLKKEFAKFDRIYIADTGNELVNAFAVDKLIDNAPTVEERPEGLWKYRPYTYYCSNCNESALEQEEYPYLSNYCPFCGAEMEIDEND